MELLVEALEDGGEESEVRALVVGGDDDGGDEDGPGMGEHHLGQGGVRDVGPPAPGVDEEFARLAPLVGRVLLGDGR